MALTLKKAQRKRVKLKIGMAGVPGSGKTLSSLLLAYGLVKKEYPQLSDDEIWSHIAVIDTENHSAELYADRSLAGMKIGEFATIAIEPPFTSEKYLESIALCTENDMYVTIIDSLTHLWDGEGGAKDKQYNIQKRTGNGFTSWKEPKAEFKRVVDKILQTNMHFLVTMRSKVEYAQEKGSDGKSSIRKLGTNPIIADGTDYEFSVVFDIDIEHTAMASKDRTGLFDGKYFKINKDIGYALVDWLSGATDAPEQVIAKSDSKEVAQSTTIEEHISSLRDLFQEKMSNGIDKESLYEIVKKHSGNPNFMAIKDVAIVEEIIKEMNEVK